MPAHHVLVTGAAGFIGSHVTQALLARGTRVTGLDNFNDYYDPARKRRNLEEIREQTAADTFEFVEGDIRDGSLIESMFNRNRFDAVANLAAMVGVRASLEDPAMYYDVNLTGTLRLLEATSRSEPQPNIVQASTSSVYGNTKKIPFVETDPCDKPLAPYPASKRASEMLGFTFHHVYNLDFTALRFFTVYGPRVRSDMMSYKVADGIKHDRKIELFNDGLMHRDWTYVSDITRGVLAALDRRLGYEVINLGRGEPVLLADFVHQVEDLMGRKAALVSAPMPVTDMAYTYADVSKARDLLGYSPSVSVPEGIRAFLDWYEKEASRN